MMELGVFREVILDELHRSIPPGYTMEVIEDYQGNDQPLTGIIFTREGKEHGPVIYVEELYKDYLDGIPPEKVVRDRMYEVLEEYQESRDVPDINCDFVLQRVYFKAASEERTRQRFRNVPTVHVPGVKGIILYPCMDVVVGGRKGNATITYENIEQDAIPVDELLSAARDNTNKRMEILPLKKKLERGLPPEVTELIESPFLVTNDKVDEQSGGMGGASIFGAQEVLEQLSGSYYIIPTSIYECLMLPVDYEPKVSRLQELLRDVNSGGIKDPITGESFLDENAVLSDYIYLCDNGMISTVEPEAVAEVCREAEM